jgi:hypothetical protein
VRGYTIVLTGYKILRWVKPVRRRKRKRKPVQREIVVDIPGLGPCKLMSAWQAKQLKKQSGS